VTTTLHDGSRLRLQPLHVTIDSVGEEHEVGRVDTGVFVAMPTPGVDLIRWLEAGHPVGEVRERFRDRHGEDPDIAAFVETLAEVGFLHSIDGEEIADRPEPPMRSWRPLLRISTPSLGWMRARPAIALWTVAATLGWLGVPVWYFLHPQAWPTASDAWIGGPVSVSLNFAVLGVLGWGLTLLHELSHLLAMRALGLDCSLTLGHRLYFVVAQTNMSSARVLPRRVRFVPYLAGMTWDLTVLLSCLVLHTTVLPYPIVGAVIYMTTMGLLFQMAFFMRTDIYYALTNWLRVGNLMEDMRHLLANAGRRLLRQRPRHDLSVVPRRELRIVRAYAAFCIAGFVALSCAAFLLYVPMLSRFVVGTYHGLGHGPLQAEFWDAAALLAVTGTYFCVLVTVSIRDFRRRRLETRQSSPLVAAA
jgi:putative peptide zinc metalloprotease protein